MSYELTFEQKLSYLHAIVTGQNSSETVKRYLAQVRQECQARSCVRVLIEERLEGPHLPLAESFQIATEETRRALGVVHAVAYVDVGADRSVMEFAENVAVNRGLLLKSFSSVAAAEKWLLEQASAGSPGRAATTDDTHNGL